MKTRLKLLLATALLTGNWNLRTENCFSQVISAGANHSLTVCSDNTVRSYGGNDYGKLGDGTTAQRTSPVQVSGLTGITAVAAGSPHSLFLKNDSTVWACGYNDHGQLGDGTKTARYTPVQVSSLTGITAVVTGGGSSSFFLKNDGTAWACGYNGSGQLGNGNQTSITTPVQVGTNITAVANGGDHTLFLKNDGTVWACGSNWYGQSADGGGNSPRQISSLSGITAVAGGWMHSLFLKNDGTVWACGKNDNGELGDGTTTQRNTPVQVSGLTGITAVAASGRHSIFLKNDGTVWACGWNSRGELGDGTYTQRTTPVQVSGLTGITAVAAGWYHSFFLKNNGTVWACGSNGNGQLAYPFFPPYDRTSPVQTTGLCTVVLPCKFTAGISKDTTVCKGSQVQLTASGGMYYKWMKGSDTSSIGKTASITIQADNTTIYNVAVSDTVCSISKSVKVTVSSSASVTGNKTVCPGDSITLTAGGGTKYLWSTGATTASLVVKPSKDTTLTVKIGNSCSDTTLSVPITMFQSASVKIQGNTLICLGNSTTLTASGGGTYLWNTAGATTAAITVSPKQDTTYKVIIFNGSCKDSASVTVKVNSKMVINAGNDSAICKGVSIILGVSGDTAGATFSWTPSAGLNDNTLANPTANPQTITTYTITATNSKCINATATDSVTITVQSPPVADAGADKAICKGNNVQIGSTSVSGNIYSWTPATGLSDTTLATPLATPIATTPYIVQVANGGCARTDTVVISVNTLPTVSAGQDVSITSGSSITLAATGASTYLWKPTTGLSDAIAYNPTANPKTTTVYSVTGTDNNGCVSMDSVIVILLDSVIITSTLPCEVSVPNAFSPNGDEKNDLLKVHGDCIKEIAFSIYNRWGEEVFKATDLSSAMTKGWDGTYKQKPMNTAVFVYYLTATLSDGTAFTKKGNISLIR